MSRRSLSPDGRSDAPRIHYAEDGPVSESCVQLKDNTLVTAALRVNFLVVDASGQFETGNPLTWTNGLLPTVWSPTIVALLLTRWADGPTGFREALGRLRYPRDGIRWLAIAAAVPASATATAVFVARAAGEGAPFIPLVAIPFVVAMQWLTGAVGEELGWRGFLLPRLRTRCGRLPVVWAGASLWSLWHVSSFFFPGMPQQLVS